MSFIAITYGYNMFSIFNTNTTSLPLVDNIKLICFDDLITSLSKRLESLNKEITTSKNDDESLKKQLKTLNDRKLVINK